MPQHTAMEAHRTGRSLRLETLVRLRWLAIIGQSTAVLVVYFGLDFDFRVWACLAVIAVAAALNLTLRIRFPMTQRLAPDRAAWLLAFDLAELAALLFFTGGLQNPFAILLIGPVLISAAGLPPRMTLMLGGFAIACATGLIFAHEPLPWGSEPPPDPLPISPIKALSPRPSRDFVASIPAFPLLAQVHRCAELHSMCGHGGKAY